LLTARGAHLLEKQKHLIGQKGYDVNRHREAAELLLAGISVSEWPS